METVVSIRKSRKWLSIDPSFFSEIRLHLKTFLQIANKKGDFGESTTAFFPESKYFLARFFISAINTSLSYNQLGMQCLLILLHP